MRGMGSTMRIKDAFVDSPNRPLRRPCGSFISPRAERFGRAGTVWRDVVPIQIEVVTPHCDGPKSRQQRREIEAPLQTPDSNFRLSWQLICRQIHPLCYPTHRRRSSSRFFCTRNPPPCRPPHTPIQSSWNAPNSRALCTDFLPFHFRWRRRSLLKQKRWSPAEMQREPIIRDQSDRRGGGESRRFRRNFFPSSLFCMSSSDSESMND